MKTTFALLLLFAAVLAGGYAFAGHQMSLARDGAAKGASPLSPAASGSSAAGASYTRVQVAAHATSQSCWTSISGNVYDLTAWISQHPGGEAAILSICGKDGTQAFEAQHSGSRSAERMLATFRIGALAS